MQEMLESLQGFGRCAASERLIRSVPLLSNWLQKIEGLGVTI